MNRVRLDSLSARGWPSPAVTIGNFDGVHRGHAALVMAAAAWARPRNGRIVALTFDPHPARQIDPERAPATLSTLEQKEELLARLGVETLAVLPFTEALANESAERFAREVVAGCLEARRVVVGEDFRFGHERRGDVELLRALGADLGFELEPVPPVLHDGRPVSSSRVREALARGDVQEAWALLGRPHFIDGTVVEGERRGRRLGIPTVNLETANETLPARGVYATRCRLPSGEWVPAVANFGRRPTFGGSLPSVEAHLIDFDDDLYGATLRLEFQARVRNERRFPGPDALVAQIRDDIARARALVVDPGRKGV
ncbi:MAG: bifunctional riboflavin kinase/FAD synthetase [Acidobacteria bacterium]|jgi:riboflavin kinase/FMN adenylyltransferase|nr:bifunctional riboflavin kinase/FAD synthetase [Acidobacteriota bacterium]